MLPHEPGELDELLGLLRGEPELDLGVVLDREIPASPIQMAMKDIGEPEQRQPRGALGNLEGTQKLVMDLGRGSPRAVHTHCTITSGERRWTDIVKASG
jgi:hypothetical protein